VTWREDAARRIAAIVRDNPRASRAELRAMLLNAFPWATRERYPYLVWLQETNKVAPSDRVLRKRQAQADESDAGAALFGREGST